MTQSTSRTELQQALDACRESFIATGVFSFFINVLMLVPSLYMLQVYDRVLTSGSESTLLMLSLVVLLLFVTLGGLEWVRSQILVRVSVRLDGLLGPRLFDASFHQALNSNASSAGVPLQDLTGLRQFLTSSGLFAFFDAPWVPVYVLVSFLFHPWFGWLAVAAIVILGGLTVLTERLTAQLLADANRESITANVSVARNLRNAEVVAAMGMLPSLRQRWRERNHQVLAAQARASQRGGILASLSRTLRLVMQSAVLGVGAYLVLQQEMTAGVMIAGSILLGRALAPIDQLTAVWRNVVTARAQYSRLDELVRSVPTDSERMPLPPPSGELSVEGLAVAPPGAPLPVVRGVSFSLNRGEVLGVIGPSASGKSTLARALLGVWPATAGRVRLDGADVSTLNRDLVGPHIGYVPQDLELFDGTVGENIARFAAIDAERVVEAARMANVHEMILKLPSGYDTIIGVAGGALSAGQRQRLALARALYGKPRLIILDEPNSNLDEQGDQALREAIRQVKAEGSTVILISHRAGILETADKLLAMSEGQVAAFGPRDQVLAKVQAPVRTAPAGVALLPVRST